MSVTAKLFIEGHSKEHKGGSPVVSCSFGFNQNVNEDGYIASRVKAGLIHISIRATEDPEIVHWMLSNSEIKNGRIEFAGFLSAGTGPGGTRKLSFKNAMLVDYSESFNELADIMVNLVITAGNITLAGESYESNWSSKGEV